MLCQQWLIFIEDTSFQLKLVRFARNNLKIRFMPYGCVKNLKPCEVPSNGLTILPECPPSSFSELLAIFLQFHEDFRKEIFILCAWCLWNRRNSLRLGLLVQPLASIITIASRMLQDLFAAQDLTLATPPHTLQLQWRPPDSQNYKANFDVAIFKASNSASIGVIIKDCDGEVIGALSLSIPFSQLVDELKALAYRRTVQFAWEISLKRVIFEGDSATVIQAITRKDSDFLPFGNIIDDI